MCRVMYQALHMFEPNLNGPNYGAISVPLVSDSVSSGNFLHFIGSRRPMV